MTLSNSEKEHYLKHLNAHDWDQEKLKSAKALIVGIGGLGSASALYLTAAGIGKLSLCDGDRVERSDLNRQILYSEESIGKLKVREAKLRLSSLNPHIEIETLATYMDDQNADELTENCDIVIDGLDNIESRFIVNRQSVKKQIPYVYGAVQGWEGFVGLFCPNRTACLGCILHHDIQRQDKIPVVGVLPGIIGLFQATEAIKFIMGVKRNLVGRLLIYDSRNLTFDIVETEKNPDCPHCAA